MSIGSILPNGATKALSAFNNVSLPTSIGSGVINNLGSKVSSELDKFNLSQAIGDGGLDSIFKGGASLKDKLFAGLPDINSIADQFSAIGGGIELGEVVNPGDLKSVVDLGTGDYKGTDVAFSDGSEFEIVEVPEVKAKALKPKTQGVATKTFVSNKTLDSQQFGNLPEFDFLQVTNDVGAGVYSPGSRFIVKSVNFGGPDGVSNEYVVAENTKYDSGKLRLIDVRDPDEVARYKRLGYTV